MSTLYHPTQLPLFVTKICPTCYIEKPATLDHFSRNRNEKSGLQPRCKKCQSIYGAAYRQRKREERRTGVKQELPRFIHPNSLRSVQRWNERKTQETRDYLASPNLCKQCHKPILPKNGKLAAAKLRQYCSNSCTTTARNLASSGFPKRKRAIIFCPTCGKEMLKGQQRRCDECTEYYKQRTERAKKQLGQLTKSESTRLQIAEHLRRYVPLPYEKKCLYCGYDKWTERCHIRPVADFPPTATLVEINDPTNILILCPTCHKEFDHGFLSLDVIMSRRNQNST